MGLHGAAAMVGADGGPGSHPDRVQVIPRAVLADMMRQRIAADDSAGSAAGPDGNEPVHRSTDLLSSGSLEPSRCALAISVDPLGADVALVTDAGRTAVSTRQTSADVDAPGLEAAERLFAALCSAVDAVLHAGGIEDEPAELRGIGLLVDGRIDPLAGSVDVGPWQAFPVLERLLERYGVAGEMMLPATALVAAEHWRGAARGRGGVLAIDWGQQIDGALVLGDRLLSGTTGHAGRIGHVCVDPYGPRCACGARGCLQAIAGGPAIADWYRARGGTIHGADADRIATAAARGDVVAAATIRRAGEAIGQAAAGIVTLLDLDVVVVGGMAGAVGARLLDAVGDGYETHAALGHAAAPRVVPAALGSRGGLVGAAAVVLVPQRYGAGRV